MQGSYTYQEYEAPPGYALDDTVYPLDITEHGKTITITVDNTAIPLARDGSITVTKKSTDGSTLTGAEYLLEYSTDNGASWQPVFSRTGDSIEAGGCTSSALNDGRLSVSSAGIATFSGLKADLLNLFKYIVDLLMDSKIYVFDLFAGKYRNINLHNYDDDRQVGVLYFDRAVLDELSRICTICGYVFFEEDGISYPIDIQPQKVVIFEGTFNCLSSKVKAIFTKHNICPSDDVCRISIFCISIN